MKKLIIILSILLCVFLIDLALGQPIPASGAWLFRILLDTPNTYSSQGLKGLRVNTGETAIEFYSFADSITLGSDTTGNYVATIADAGNSAITVGGSGSENAAVTLDITANGIELATDTTGNYVATLADSGSSTFTIANSGSEDAAVTIALTADSVDNEHINWTDIDYLVNEGAGVDEAYAAGWNGDVGPPEKDDVYDYLVQFDADADGSFTDETWLTEWPGSASITTLGADSVGGDEILDADYGDFTFSSGSATLNADVVGGDEILDADYGDFTFSSGSATLNADVVGGDEILDADYGDFTFSSGSATLNADVVGGDEILDADYGDFTFSSGSATLNTDSVGDNEIDYPNVTFDDFDYQGNYKTFYSDGSGEVQELANGTTAYVLTSQGTGTAPHWAVAAGAAGGDAWSDPVDAHIIPTGADDTYDVGSSTNQFRNGYFDGTMEADVLTEGGNDVYNSSETPGGELGGTWASPTIDDDVIDFTEIVDLMTLDASTTIRTDDKTLIIQASSTQAVDIFVIKKSDSTDLFRVESSGTVDLIHTSTANNDHTLELITDAAGFGDVKSLDIDYITGAISAGEDEAIILINIDETAATGGDVFGLEVLSTEGSAAIYGMKVGAIIGPVHQDSGVFSNPDTGTDNTIATVVAAMIDGTTTTTTAIFESDNEYIIVGASSTFEEIEFILTTVASGGGISPTFGYSISGSNTFTTFSPVDGTNGFKNTGLVAWDASDLTSHTTNDATNSYDILVTRTKNSLSTSPILGFMKTASTTEYVWDKDGNVNVNNLTAAGTVEGAVLTEGGVAVYNLNELNEWPGSASITTLGADSVGGDEILDADYGDFTFSSGSATLNADVVGGDEILDADYGDFTFSSGSATLNADVVGGDEILDADYGDFTFSSGSATLNADVVGGDEILDADYGDFTFLSGSATINADSVALTTDTTGNYVATIADGTGIDGTASGEGATYTPTFDATELTALTWSAGGSASITHTFDGSGSADTSMQYGDGYIIASGTINATGLQINGVPVTSGGATAWDDIGPADAISTVDFQTYTQTMDIGKSDADGGDGLVLDSTADFSGIANNDVFIFKITTADDDDQNYIPISVYDDSDANNDLLFQVDYNGNIFTAYGLDAVGAVDLDYGSVDVTDHTFTTDGTGDAEFVVPNDSIGPAELDTANTWDFSAGTMTVPSRLKNLDNHFIFNLFNPNSLYDTDTQICIKPILPATITITRVIITLDADPATELDIDLKFANAFIGMASATLIVAIDTTNGTTDINTFNVANIPQNECLYVEFGADPIGAIKQACVDIIYDYD